MNPDALKNSRYVLVPLILAAAFVVLLTVVPMSSWTWSLYDEYRWVQHAAQDVSVVDFFKREVKYDLRIRPVVAAVNFTKIAWFGYRPHALRVVRVLEFVSLLGLILFYMRRRLRLSLLAAAFGVGFLVKSPPVLEQTRWMMLMELQGLLLIFSALLVYERGKYGKIAAYALLVLAALAKEPLVLFVALPATLSKRFREAAAFLLLALGYMGTLYLNRRGYGNKYGAGLYPGAHAEILRQGLVDMGLLIAIAAAALYSIRGKSLRWMGENPRLWNALVFGGFGAAYAAVVFPMCWGYTYMLAPFAVMMSVAAALLVEHLTLMKAFGGRLQKTLVVFLVGCAMVFPARWCWNWSKVYARSNERLGVINAAAKLPPGTIGANCHIDGWGLQMAVEMLRGVHPLKVSADGLSCANPGEGVAKCCKNARYLAVGRECSDFDGLVAEARGRGLKPLYANAGWSLFLCK